MAAPQPWGAAISNDEKCDPDDARILIADDQPDVLHALRMLLKPAGCAVELASTPRGALARLSEGQFDAVIIDLNYTLDTTSGNEGIDLLTAIKADYAEIPVIVMTAWATMDIAIEAMRRGACDFIQKPWNNAQVLETVASQVARRRRQRREFQHRQAEVEDARSVQRALLPRGLPTIAGFELAAWTQSARAVGGDYYDIFAMDGRLVLVIADVCGKGIAAALTMSNLQGAVRSLVSSEPGPAALCRKLNRLLRPSMLDGRFVSLFCAMLDIGSGDLRFCNAGHPPAVAVTKGGDIAHLRTGGAVLGHFEDWPYEEDTITLKWGDAILVFTDGIVDAANSDDTEFGEAGVINAVRQGSSDADSIRAAVTAAVAQHCRGRFEDDATVVVLHRK